MSWILNFQPAKKIGPEASCLILCSLRLAFCFLVVGSPVVSGPVFAANCPLPSGVFALRFAPLLVLFSVVSVVRKWLPPARCLLSFFIPVFWCQ